MAKKKEKPFATINIKLYDNSRVVEITGFKRVNERVLGDLERFIREELYLLRAAAARVDKARKREEEASADASLEDVSTGEGGTPAPPSSEEVEALRTSITQGG